METKSEINNPNITYWLGAGASANAIPIVSAINKVMDEMIYLIKIMTSLFKNSNPHHITIGDFNHKSGILNIFEDFANKWANEIQSSPSIDTYAKRLYDNDRINEYNEYKAFLTVLFHFFHFNNYNFYDRFSSGDLPKEKQEEQKDAFTNKLSQTKLKVVLEGRYENFFRSIISKSEKEGSHFNTSIPENFNFLSWNYDFQFEFNRFLDIKSGHSASLTEQMDYFKSEIGRNFLKINGSSFIENLNPSGYSQLLNPENNFELYKLLLFVFEYYYDKKFQTDTFRFSWEDGKERIIEKLHKISEITDILVVIGYSFPSFNREMDKEFYSKLKPECIIYTQGYDMNDSKRIENYFKQCFARNDSKKNVYPVESPFFFIPPQFYGVEEIEADVW